MSKKLIVVESPNKTKKIASYLGPGYEVVATVGHFCDLPPRELGVDVETMQPTYVVDDKKKSIVSRLKSKSAEASEVLIATDPDREGEAIGWHVSRVLKLGGKAKRIDFNAITKDAVNKAVSNPRPLDNKLVDAQQARRVLDRLVGYKVSPLLQSLGSGLSAGRVQTATLHLVCQRERDRLNFKPEPYWVLKVRYANGLVSELCEEKGKAVRPKVEAEAFTVAKQAEQSPHKVLSVERKEAQKRAPAPFTTSTLQQAASSRLNFDPSKTMQLAQALFEAGQITYHRSDSPTLSEEGVGLARSWIQENRPGSLPAKAPTYRSKEGAQEAHEAIRPTSLDQVEIDPEQKALYDLIRARFLASQMSPARLAKTIVITQAPDGKLHFAARGSEVLESHWLSLYAEDEEGEADKDEQKKIPTVQEGENLDVSKVALDKKLTQPPPRFTEATLIEEMEKLGIGRPSTYAATTDVLFRRTYVEKEKKNVAPTVLGLQVDDLMLEGLPELTSHEYTAQMEEELDRIASGYLRWKEYLQDWWSKDFKLKLAKSAQVWASKIEELHKKAAAGDGTALKATGLDHCPECGKKMKRRKGKTGDFWGCTGFPDCKTTLPIAAKAPGKTTDIVCKSCGKTMIERKGSKGKFLGCSGYPECRETAPIELTQARAKKCPECGSVMVKRQGVKGPFWGCSGYPECKHTEDAGEKSSGGGRKGGKS